MPKKEKDVKRLEWRHNGMYMTGEIGGLLPMYFGTGHEPVLTIVEDDLCFVIKTKSRGGEYGPPIFAGKSDVIKAVYA